MEHQHGEAGFGHDGEYASREVAVRVRILGPLLVEDESGRAIELGPPKQRSLLGLLALNPNCVLSTDRIVDELWGDRPPSDGPRNVRVYISRLRELLEPERTKGGPGRVIVTEAPGYALRIDADDIDAHRFERLVGEARRELDRDPGSARSTIGRALGLWRDRPLADLAFEEFAQSEVRRLEELHLSALELRHEAAIRLGEESTALPELEKLVAQHPLRERLVALLMQGLAGSGRRAEALRAYRSLQLRLADEVGLEPSVELRRLEEQILLQQQPRADEPERSDVGNLPARLTSLVGREVDLDEIARLLTDSRLLTLTGPGGVGKTSLAIEAARRAAPRYEGRVRLVDFSPLRGSASVVAAVAGVLGVRDAEGVALQSAIAAALRRERNLVVLDNAEHVVEAVSPLVVALLREVLELTIICTSRRSLAVPGESVFEVGPLELPPADSGVDDLREITSAILLSERAAAASRGFEITTENAGDVAELCRRLDGIPLAIELAASHLRFVTTGEMVVSLADRLALGTRQRSLPHHRTLRATIQWSYDLLAEAEQRLFDRLSVFVGRFSRAAAGAVGTGAEDVEPPGELEALVDASMVVADVSGPAASYRMLPTLRDFGIFNLRESGELESMRRAHAEYLAADAEEMRLPLFAIGATTRLEKNASIEDFRAAADWALRAGRTELAADLFVPLSHHWIDSGRIAEAAHWLGRLRQLAVEGSLELWRLELAAAMLDSIAGRYEEAKATVRSARSLTLQMGEASATAAAFHLSGYVRWRLGDLRGAREDMATAAEAVSDWVGRGRSPRQGLAVLELCLGNVAEAERHADLLAAFADRTHDEIATCDALHVRGWVACYQGDLNASVRSFEQCRDIAVEVGDWHHEVDARLGLGWVLPALGSPDEALAQAQAARALAVGVGNPSKHGEAALVIGGALLEKGDLFDAARSVAEGLEVLRERVRQVDHMLRGLRTAGRIALASGRGDLVVRFLVTADGELRRIGYVDPPFDADRSTSLLSEAIRSVGDTGRSTPTIGDASFAGVLDEAIAYLAEVASSP